MKLEDELRRAIRAKQYSRKTEESYVGWYRRYVLWHGKKHLSEMGAEEVSAFLTHLAADRDVVEGTQNQALNALVLLYQQVLGKELEGISAVRAKQKRHLPVVLSVEEMGRLMRGGRETMVWYVDCSMVVGFAWRKRWR